MITIFFCFIAIVFAQEKWYAKNATKYDQVWQPSNPNDWRRPGNEYPIGACDDLNEKFRVECSETRESCLKSTDVHDCVCTTQYVSCANRFGCGNIVGRQVALQDYHCWKKFDKKMPGPDNAYPSNTLASDPKCTLADVELRACLKASPQCWSDTRTCHACIESAMTCLKSIECTDVLNGCDFETPEESVAPTPPFTRLGEDLSLASSSSLCVTAALLALVNLIQ